MHRKTVMTAALIFVMMAGVGITPAAAQPSEPENGRKAERTLNAYRLDFSINELDDGKRINTRQYSLHLNSDNSNELKIGTRVPVESKQGEFQYLDVGTSIWSSIREVNGAIDLSVRAEISNFALPEQSQNHDMRPVLRQLKINAGTLAVLGKPMVVGSVDDPNSKRQFQLEVTVTKLK
jgi:hypothetical protein